MTSLEIIVAIMSGEIGLFFQMVFVAPLVFVGAGAIGHLIARFM